MTMATKKAEPKAAAEKAPYRITKWNGEIDNYECGLCPAAYLDKAVLEGHVKDRHNATLADAPS